MTWFITVARFKRTCDECDKTIAPQESFAYQHETATSLCRFCATAQHLDMEPSRKYLKHKEAQRIERIAKTRAIREPTLF
jgi:hypothetical protein